MGKLNFESDLNLNGNDLMNANIQDLNQDPANPEEGRIYFNTVIKQIKYYDGTQWQILDNDKGVYNVVDGKARIVANGVEEGNRSVGEAQQINVEILTEEEIAYLKNLTGIIFNYRDANNKINDFSYGSIYIDSACTNKVAEIKESVLKSTTIRGTCFFNIKTGTLSEGTYYWRTEPFASGNRSHAEGNNTSALGDYSHSEGSYSAANGGYSHAEGYHAIASGSSSHAEGNFTIASGILSHAEGDQTVASGTASHAEGFNAKAPGVRSHAEGSYSTSEGEDSHAEGHGTTASGNCSHAEGLSTTASGTASHAEGQQNVSSGNNSHSEGAFCHASDDYSHAEGESTNASSKGSHSEGHGTLAANIYSHAEGLSTTASGTASHAEGESSFAAGERAHAEGLHTYAGGSNSHAGGKDTTANGNYAFSHGNGIINNSSLNSAFIVGNYNYNTNNELFVLGNGKDSLDRSNLISSQNNNVYIQYVGGYDGTSTTEPTGIDHKHDLCAHLSTIEFTDNEWNYISGISNVDPGDPDPLQPYIIPLPPAANFILYIDDFNYTDEAELEYADEYGYDNMNDFVAGIIDGSAEYIGINKYESNGNTIEYENDTYYIYYGYVDSDGEFNLNGFVGLIPEDTTYEDLYNISLENDSSTPHCPFAYFGQLVDGEFDMDTSGGERADLADKQTLIYVRQKQQ